MSEKENKKYKEMDFEIQFFEGIIKKSPDFIETLIVLGDLYTKRGFYEKGLQVDQKLSQLRPKDSMILYNLACSYSLMNDIDRSLEIMLEAIQCGYNDFDYLEHDSDLLNLHQDNRFKQFLSEAKHKLIGH